MFGGSEGLTPWVALLKHRKMPPEQQESGHALRGEGGACPRQAARRMGRAGRSMLGASTVRCASAAGGLPSMGRAPRTHNALTMVHPSACTTHRAHSGANLRHSGVLSEDGRDKHHRGGDGGDSSLGEAGLLGLRARKICTDEGSFEAGACIHGHSKRVGGGLLGVAACCRSTAHCLRHLAKRAKCHYFRTQDNTLQLPSRPMAARETSWTPRPSRAIACPSSLAGCPLPLPMSAGLNERTLACAFTLMRAAGRVARVAGAARTACILAAVLRRGERRSGVAGESVRSVRNKGH